VSRFFADAWMLFPTEEEYIDWFTKAGEITGDGSSSSGGDGSSSQSSRSDNSSSSSSDKSSSSSSKVWCSDGGVAAVRHYGR
jgi:hypothetical protein